MKIFAFLCLLIFSQSADAGEADHYTDRDLFLEDVSIELNEIANNYLEEAVQKTNDRSSCDDEILYEEMTKFFANHTKGLLVKEILFKNYVPKRTIGLKSSVYSEWSIFNGFLMGKKSAANSPLALTPMIKIGAHVVGTDKLEHMFGMGQIYFKKFYLKGRKLRSVLKGGIAREKTFLGGNIFATGVFSYADLSANFNGMRFWNHVLQNNDDILGKGQNLGPYVTCSNGKFQVSEVKKIDFRNYVDASMDESINCSKFATKKGLKKFVAGMKKAGQAFSCPMSKERLSDMFKKYDVLTPKDKKKRAISHWILNSKGNGKVSYFNEF